MNFYHLQAFVNKLKNKKMVFEITDKQIYRSIHWTVETEEDIYFVQLQEDEITDFWFITSDNSDQIDPTSEMGKQLIELCVADLNN
jgi:hypothetical protein